MSKDMGFCHSRDIYPINMENNYWLDTTTKTGLDALNSASKKVVHKAAEAAGKYIGKNIAAKIVKADENLRNVEEIIIPPEKSGETFDKLRQVLQKWNTVKYLNH